MRTIEGATTGRRGRIMKPTLNGHPRLSLPGDPPPAANGAAAIHHHAARFAIFWPFDRESVQPNV